jgi:hypothetical protein
MRRFPHRADFLPDFDCAALRIGLAHNLKSAGCLLSSVSAGRSSLAYAARRGCGMLYPMDEKINFTSAITFKFFANTSRIRALT